MIALAIVFVLGVTTWLHRAHLHGLEEQRQALEKAARDRSFVFFVGALGALLGAIVLSGTLKRR